ncbi:MAG: cysteine desulfurase [Lachnospiraceae bacterium]|nr:cysteine desulfurase [Lachnospiraceae bacterium]
MGIYLDNSATTRAFDEVAAIVSKKMTEEYGNPSSMHECGFEAEKAVKAAAETIASTLKVNAKEILFTSGGTESDNLALIGCAFANKRKGMHLITTSVEHPAILNTMHYLEEQGFSVTYLPVDASGRISLEDLEKAITPETILVSIMHTNNEVGSRMPIAEAGALIKKIDKDIIFHVDAVQGYGKDIIRPKKMNIDLLSVSGHKIHGPKGVGFLYINEKIKIKPIIFGGGQQEGLRSGTENVPGIAGMALAAKMLYDKYDEDIDRLYSLKKRFIDGILFSGLEDLRLNGLVDNKTDMESIKMTAPHIVSLSIIGVRSEVMLHTLEDEGIYVSAGSACSSHKPQPSATLTAMGIDKAGLESTIRFSFSVFTTEADIDRTLEAIKSRVTVLRKYIRH